MKLEPPGAPAGAPGGFIPTAMTVDVALAATVVSPTAKQVVVAASQEVTALGTSQTLAASGQHGGNYDLTGFALAHSPKNATILAATMTIKTAATG